jgi:hypothetical protein
MLVGVGVVAPEDGVDAGLDRGDREWYRKARIRARRNTPARPTCVGDSRPGAIMTTVRR